MEMAITYTNNRGESITFGGDEDDLNFFENDLRDAEWEYEVSGGSVAYFDHPKKEIDLKVGIAADTEADGLAWRDRLADITEADVIDGTPGTISVNGWDMPCYVIAREAGNWWMDGRFFESTLTLLVLRRVWSRTHTHRFDPAQGSTATGDLDFSYDYPHDFSTGSLLQRTVENPGIDGADLVIRVYGEVTDPVVTVAGNAYGVTGSIPSGAYLEIDTERELVRQVGEFGDETDLFADRLAGGEGSGSYVFERMPRGVQAVSADSSVKFDVLVVEHRSEPRWVEEVSE